MSMTFTYDTDKSITFDKYFGFYEDQIYERIESKLKGSNIKDVNLINIEKTIEFTFYSLDSTAITNAKAFLAWVLAGKEATYSTKKYKIANEINSSRMEKIAGTNSRLKFIKFVEQEA